MSSELGVIIKARDLAEYIFLITERSPKKFRMTLTARMHNLALDVIENLYRANSIKVKTHKHAEERIDMQRQSKVSLDMLCCIAEIARKQQCIQPKHYGQICMRAAEIQRMLYAWARSDKHRFNDVK